MHRFSLARLARAGLLASLAACTPAVRAPDATTSRPYVIMVSFDAFRYDYIDRFRPAAFGEIAARGVRASAMIPSFPSKTFPNHYTLATGLYPGHHGIVGNAFFDPARRAWYRLNDPKAVQDSSWYSGEPLWVTAERAGVKSGVYFWSGSEAAIEGVRPSYFTYYDLRVTNSARVDGVTAWLRKPGPERPKLVMLYFSEVDDTTHKYGPDAPTTAAAVASVDRTLRRLLDSVAALPFRDSVNIVLVSDHGMAQIPPMQVLPVGDLLARAGVDTTRIEVSDNGPTMSLWFGADSARLRRAHQVLDTSLGGHARAYFRNETPERWHIRDNPRAGDLLLVADEGYILERRGSDRGPSRGAHGYDPSLRVMHGIFLAAGPNVRPLGIIPPFENVHVYPFVAGMLKLATPRVDGTLEGLGSRILR